MLSSAINFSKQAFN